MKLAMAVVLVSSMAIAARSQDVCPEVASLNALYEVRAARLHAYSSSYEVGSEIDRQIDNLREPLRDGAYRWVHYVRPGGDASVVKRDHDVSKIYNGDNWDSFEVTGKHVFAVNVNVPKKRNLFKANNEVFVNTLTVRYIVEGRPAVIRKTIGEWMAPTTSRTFDLDAIADSADATVEVAARPGKKKETVAEIIFKEAVAQDDPDNPNYETIQALQRLRGLSDPAAIDYEIGRLERRIFPSLEPAPFTTFLLRIKEAETLIRSSKEEEQNRGKKMLAEVIRSYPR
ncbi:MAG TPA: hypothetical protein VHL58_04585 [Thermoanaerobaculia bacterium]|nr:hypothetical protein [Thermoanaerobaculia bacterium]